MSKTKPPTPLMRAACSHAEDALILAIEAVDYVLGENFCVPPIVELVLITSLLAMGAVR